MYSAWIFEKNPYTAIIYNPDGTCLLRGTKLTFKDEAQTALFKDPVRTAL